MPDPVEFLGEEELLPGQKWHVFRNARTGQVSKVPAEIMRDPELGPKYLAHLGGYDTNIVADMKNRGGVFSKQSVPSSGPMVAIPGRPAPAEDPPTLAPADKKLSRKQLDDLIKKLARK